MKTSGCKSQRKPSIPAGVTYLYEPFVNAHRIRRHRYVSRRRRDSAGFDAEARTVARADDFVPFEPSVGERGIVVGANVFDGVELAVQIEHGDLHIIDIDDAAGPRHQFRNRGDRYPIRHAKYRRVKTDRPAGAPPRSCSSDPIAARTPARR